MFTIIILETPQPGITIPLPLEGTEIVKPIERLRVNVSKITEAQMKQISKLAWKFPRKTRKDKGLKKPKKAEEVNRNQPSLIHSSTEQPHT